MTPKGYLIPMRKAASHRSGFSGSSKLQNSLLASVSGEDISRVLNGNNSTTCKQQILPGPLQIYDVDTVTFLLVYVLLHLKVKVSAT